MDSPGVLMLVENLSVPADPRVWREAQTLSQHGFQVSIICPMGETQDREAYACIDGIHIYRYRPVTTGSSSTGYMKEYAVALVKTFCLSLKVWRRHGFDVIHAANPPDTFFLIGLFYRLYGKYYIFDQHDLAPSVFRVRFAGRMQLLYRLLRFFESCSYRTAHIIITTNESQRRNALSPGARRSGQVFVVRNGPDLSRYLQTPPEPTLKRGKRYMLAYRGVMGAQDGVEYALYALKELIQRHGRRDVLLTLIGDGDQLPRLRALTQVLELEPYTHFTGWLTPGEMLRYLSTADIGLSPDPSNELNDRSTMLKTMEYMAMGKPVVAFDLPETRYSAQDAALYATPNRVEEFAAHISALLDDEALRLSMGARGRQRIEDELCWEHTSRQLLLAYEQLFPAPSASQQPQDSITVSAGH
jgi:glycosyltransferase involved in cell wall biosynthesis